EYVLFLFRRVKAWRSSKFLAVSGKLLRQLVDAVLLSINEVRQRRLKNLERVHSGFKFYFALMTCDVTHVAEGVKSLFVAGLPLLKLRYPFAKHVALRIAVLIHQIVSGGVFLGPVHSEVVEEIFNENADAICTRGRVYPQQLKCKPQISHSLAFQIR